VTLTPHPLLVSWS